jgi:membrane fusion protein (multidrug efflux system)
MTRWKKVASDTSINVGKLKAPSWIPIPLLVFAPVLCIGLGATFVAGVLPRIVQEKELDARQVEKATLVPVVPVARVHRAKKQVSLVLPGDLDGIQKVIVYARTDGYLKSCNFDIGDHVTTGQLLMVIDNPEIQKQLMQAQAQLKGAQANVESAKADLVQSTANLTNQKATVRKISAQLAFSSSEVQRYTRLAQRGVVSYEQRDQARQNYETDLASMEAAKAAVEAADAQISSMKQKVAAAVANVEMHEANVARVRTTESFQRVISPCEGYIQGRNVDPGQLISAGSGNSNTVLGRILRTDPMRAFINVPQRFYRAVHLGQTAEVTVPELKGQTFPGVVAHIASALNPATRTLEVEVHVPNKDGKLVAATYAQVKLTIDRSNPPLLVPATALDVRPDGQYVVIVDPDGRVHRSKIEVDNDNGTEVEISSGVKDGDTVVLEPNEDIKDGQRVKPDLRDLTKKADNK